MTPQTAILLVTPLLLGLVAGFVTGGRLMAVTEVRLRALWLLWVAAGFQVSQHYADDLRRLIEERIGLPMVGVVFAIVLVWLAVNLGHWRRAMWFATGVILLGAVLNGAAIAANGRMPYSPQAAVVAGMPANVTTAKNEPAHERTRLAVLGDILPVPPLHKVISIGDTFIGLGTALMLASAMHSHRSHLADQIATVGEEVNHDGND